MKIEIQCLLKWYGYNKGNALGLNLYPLILIGVASKKTLALSTMRRACHPKHLYIRWAGKEHSVFLLDTTKETDQ
jgi:hypothetical protein